MTLSQAKAGQLAQGIIDLMHLAMCGSVEIDLDDWNAAMSLVDVIAMRVSPAERAALYDIGDALKSLRGTT